MDAKHKPPPVLDLESLKAVTVLGRGAKGVVFLIKQHSKEETRAMKVISKDLIQKRKKKTAINEQQEEEQRIDYYKRSWFERDMLSMFDHPLLPKLRGVLSTRQLIGFTIDYCSGGDLNALRRNQTEQMFSDDVIRFYAAELVLVLEYLHGLGVVYRDLKPENIMIQHNGHLMIVDFDLSTKLQPCNSKNNTSGKSNHFQTPAPERNNPHHHHKLKSIISSFLLCKSGISQVESVETTESESGKNSGPQLQRSNSFVGTEDYVAPEIIQGKGHDFAVDWWSLGVVLYEMLYGRTPFRGINRKETFYRILSKSPELVGEKTSLRDLIAKLLEKDPSKRITVEEVKEHDFFKGINWDTVMHISRPPYIPITKWVDEELEDIQGMDVQQVVNGIFDGDYKLCKQKHDENVEKSKDSWNLDENKSDWVGGLRNKNYDDFFFF